MKKDNSKKDKNNKINVESKTSKNEQNKAVAKTNNNNPKKVELYNSLNFPTQLFSESDYNKSKSDKRNTIKYNESSLSIIFHISVFLQNNKIVIERYDNCSEISKEKKNSKYKLNLLKDKAKKNEIYTVSIKESDRINKNNIENNNKLNNNGNNKYNNITENKILDKKYKEVENVEPKKFAEKGKLDIKKNTPKDKKEKAEVHISEVKDEYFKNTYHENKENQIPLEVKFISLLEEVRISNVNNTKILEQNAKILEQNAEILQLNTEILHQNKKLLERLLNKK